MTVLMERLEDGRMIFNKEGIRDYLTEFLCDTANDAANSGEAPIDHPIMAMLATTIDNRRDDMIVNMVDALFKPDGSPVIQALHPVYRTIFGMKLEDAGEFIYGTNVEDEKK